MRDQPSELPPAPIGERRIERAGLLLWTHCLIALDAEAGDFTRIVGAPEGPLWIPLALSADGRLAVFRTQELDASSVSLVLHTLSSGAQRWFHARDDRGLVQCAALSPDNRCLALLSDDGEGGAFISIVDVATSARRLLWAGEGSASQHEGGLAWSPDGQLIAATYFADDEDELPATVVLRAMDGAVLALWPEAGMVQSTNGAWIGNRELLLWLEENEPSVPPLAVVSTEGAPTRRFEREWRGEGGGCLAVIDGRLIQTRGSGLSHSELNGHDEKPFITMPAHTHVRFFDVAPKVLGYGPRLGA